MLYNVLVVKGNLNQHGEIKDQKETIKFGKHVRMGQNRTYEFCLMFGAHFKYYRTR